MFNEDNFEEEKKRELFEAASTIKTELAKVPDELITEMLEAFAEVKGPEEAEVYSKLITIHERLNEPEAVSQRPGHLILNWPKLIDIVPDTSLVTIGATTLPIPQSVAMLLAALYVWNKVCRGSKEDLTKIEAIVMLALWKNRNGRRRIDEEVGFRATNALMIHHSMPVLTTQSYAHAINRLVKLRCIQLDGGVINLVELVRIKFT